MNAAGLGPGGYPATPAGRAAGRGGAPPSPPPSPRDRDADRNGRNVRNSLPLAPENVVTAAGDSQPLIPTTVLDAPTQRFYVVAVYVCLLAWKFYDWIGLVEDNTESLWLFLKWIGIDLVFIFGLPELRIPWLELNQPFTIGAFFLHFVFDFMLMFNIPLPFQGWLLGMAKMFYDREISISEHSVKVSSILHNSSLIMGKQIINILPEGSAILNPEKVPFCLGNDIKTVKLPLQFNATIPVEVEIIRTDLDTNKEEVLKLSRSELRDIERATKRQSPDGAPTTVDYTWKVKKPGVYRLGKVLDEYKLEVQRKIRPTFVVPCPQARVAAPASSTRCRGDLSDLSLQVDGTPPLKIVYSRTINGKDHSFHFQSLQPEGFSSPLMGSGRSSALILPDDEDADTSWARSQRVLVGLNESMTNSGEWQYSIDEVVDAFGNTVRFPSVVDDIDAKPKARHLVQDFVVKERPRVRLNGCDTRNPLKVAKGKPANLPVSFDIAGSKRGDTSHTLAWQYSPIDTLTKNGDHGDVVTTGSHKAKDANDKPTISSPGLYTLKSVFSGSCEGEIQEPSSCLLLNPLEPELSLRAQEMSDNCAGNAIGLRVDLDLIGTPPFIVRYDVVSNNERPRQESVKVNGVRYQLDLTPIVAGHHEYVFKSIADSVYRAPLPLSGPEMRKAVDVKPPATALLQHSTGKMTACLEEEAEVDVRLIGEGPFTLEYELVHNGKRKQEKIAGVEGDIYRIKTRPLSQGGEYTLALTSIQDKTGCRNFLQQELKISVSQQRPQAAFGKIDYARKTKIIEGTKARLPLRLSGDAPWILSYRNLEAPDKIIEGHLSSPNDFIDVSARGSYEIMDIYDKQCHGVIDSKASHFDVDWYPRPEISLIQTDSISLPGDKYVKKDVCEGDIDGFDIMLKGSPPYHVEYEVRYKPTHGSGAIGRKAFDAALGQASIQMDTSKAGSYVYQFSALADNLYNSDKNFHPLILEQRVNAKPSAAFVKPGQSFKYCKDESEHGDRIPITLTGAPPFSVEIEIKHQSGATPDIYRIPSIDSNSYNMQIPRQHLKLGTQQIRIRKVQDSHGCSQRNEIGGPSVQVHLYDAPAMYPLESRTDYCVGERIAYTLSGTPPFEVWYNFGGSNMKAKSSTTNFRRIAESPGEFTITSISDKASECRAAVDLKKTIHPMPSVRISRGRNVRVDIHEGSEVPIVFEFWGTPPFEFTFTRSTNAKRGQKSQVLETRHDVSYEHTKTITASQEGTYEVVAIKDKYCAFSTQQVESKDAQKLLKY